MRIFCGLANVNEAVAAALVNERGGVVATAEVSDDPDGYFALCDMWVRHAEIRSVTVADDGSTTTLLRLAAGAGQPVTTDAPRPGDAQDGLDVAVHIARSLCHGALPSGIEPSEDAFRRVLAAAQTMAASRYTARSALVELLRQCHPAVLMAWEDPTDDDALALLRALPDPAEAATAEATELVGALRSVADPRTIGTLMQSLGDVSRAMEPVVSQPGIAEAIVGAIDSVQSCDRSLDALAETLSALMRPSRTPRSSRRQAAREPETAQHPVTPPQTAPPSPQQRRTAAPMPPPAEPPAAAPPPGPAMPRRTPRPERSESVSRGPAVTPPHSEPRTHQFETSEPVTPSHGFPQMPEPPSFVEPLTEHLTPSASAPSGPDVLSAPVGDLPSDIDSEDDDLLIFSQARSAWFKGPAALDDAEDDWTPADAGWRAAAAAATSQDAPAETTGKGLPRRVPQANLVPGSAILSETKPTPIKRDASALASHTAGYFRGWTRARRETVGAGTR